MKIQGKVWVVTGAGSGIGRALTIQLIERGARVAMVDINADGMQETATMAGADQVSIHVLNIADRAAVGQLPQAVIEAHGQVDAIINNAGIIQPFVSVQELSYDVIQRVMDINFYGTLYLCKAFLPYLIDRPEAYIANISSMGGFIPFPGQTLYSASKAAVKLLTEGLYAELKDTTVGVSVVHPGAIDTHIMSNSGLLSRKEEEDSKKTAANKALPASEAAAIILRGIEKNKYRILVGKDAGFLDLFYRLSPKRAVHFIVKQMGNRG